MRIEDLFFEEVIDLIIKLNTELCHFWSKSHGWAPRGAADLMSKSRLDRQVSLSHSLKLWSRTPDKELQDAIQILGYANLGALLEGTMKLFLSVYVNDYMKDVDAFLKKGVVREPDGLELEHLRQFFAKRIWDDSASDNWNPWIERIQYRRNAIHAYRDRDIGKLEELHEDVRIYLRFLIRVNGQLPYPDGAYVSISLPGHPYVSSCDAPVL